MAKKRFMNLGFGTDPDAINMSALPPQSQGQIGGFYEQNEKRWQFYKHVDGAGAAGDVVYNKSYDGKFEATDTIANASIYEVAGVVTTTVTENYYTLLRKGGTFSTKANGVFAAGMNVWPDSGNVRVVPGGVFSGALAAVDTGGGVFSVANPCTGAWMVTRVVVNRTTATSGVCTVDIGVHASSPTTLNDGLIDGLNANATAANGENNFANAGTNGKAQQWGPAGSYLNASVASGASAGLVGTYSGTFEMVGFPNPPSLGTAQGTISGGKVSVALDIPYL